MLYSQFTLLIDEESMFQIPVKDRFDLDFYFERIFHEEEFVVNECPEISIPSHYMTFTQTEKADNAFTDCSANGLCLAVIQMGSSFQTVSLQQPGPNISGDIVPFIKLFLILLLNYTAYM